MRVKASDYTGLQAAIQRALAKEVEEQPAKPNVMWLARIPLLKIKPIVSRDPEAFMRVIKKLQGQYPKLKIYIFEIEGL